MSMILLVGALGFLLGAAVAALVLVVRGSRVAAESARLQGELSAARTALDEQRALVAAGHVQVRESFVALSRDALKDNRSDFLESADALLKPVRESLERVHAQLASVDKAREGSFQAVASQLQSLSAAQEQLRSATEGLSRSLRSPNVRGKWGEIQLRRIVELAGMLEHCDFLEKPSSTTTDGFRQTPDLVVLLPGDSSIVVDSKVPIDAYLAATNAASETERQTLLAAHARQVRDHIRALGSKEYWRQFDPAPEFVVMFLPLEPLLAVAFEQDGTLLEQAASLRVIPATPMTLLALLKAVAYGWQQRAVAANAAEIQTLGRELYERLATMIEHLETVGRNIKQAADGYDRFVGSLEQKVVPSARRFRELGVTPSKSIEIPEALSLRVRAIKKDDLITESVRETAEEEPSLFES
jgi:DNA recombination protein RmuC